MRPKRSTGRSPERPFGSAGPNGPGRATAPVAYAMAVVGTSWGGLTAIRGIVSCLPPELGLPIVVVQHRHRDSDALLARFLQDFTHLRVCEVEDKQAIEPGRVFVAPANYHLLVES